MKLHFPRWAATLGLVVASVIPAHAATFVVRATADTDGATCGPTDCTLRQAINAANGAAGANSITFDSSAFAAKQPIYVNGVLPSINGDLTIQGPTATGAGVSVVGNNNGSNGPGGTPVFRITGGTVTISDLTATGGTVGISARAGNVTVQRCTLNNNGTGISVGTANVTAQGCTLFGNINSGLSNTNGTAAIQSCTVIQNAQGISAGSSTSLSNTLVLGNSADVSGPITDNGFNLIGGSAMDAGLQTDSNGNPILADNGGPVFTVALVTLGKAVDQGRSSLATDALGKPRHFDFPAVANAVFGDDADIGAFEEQDSAQTGSYFVVNSTSDHDDGVCGVANCTLREAIGAANAASTTSFATSITFNSPVFAVKQTIALTNGSLPTISAGTNSNYSVTILGPEDPGTGVTIKGGASDTIFTTRVYNLTLSSLTITGGAVGLSTRNGGTDVERCTFSGNGDGVVTAPSGGVHAVNCTFTGNTNSALHSLGGNLNIENCTVAGNAKGVVTTLQAGTPAPSVSLDNSIVAANPGGNLSAPLTDYGYNLCDDNGQGLLTAATDKLNTSPGLDPAGLRDNGGPVATIALVTGSAAIDAGNSTLPTDARGLARPVDFSQVPNTSGGNGADIGAFELNEAPQSGPNFVVNNVSDHDDSVCGPLDCTLREAINAANAGSKPSVITFDGTAFAAPSKIIDASYGGLPAITSDLTITAPPAGVTVRVADTMSTNLFAVSSGTVTFVGLTVRGGPVGVGATGGNVTLRACTIIGNTYSFFGVTRGVQNTGATLTIENSTITGCGVGVSTSGGTTTLQSCTVAGNSTNLKITGGTVSVGNSIVAANGGTNVSGTINDLGYNLCDDTGGGAFSTSTDKLNANANLGPLQDNGGPTFTLALPKGSPAVDAGSTTLATDERGVSRDGKPDIGAFEFNTPSLSIGSVSQLAGTSGTKSFDFIVTLSAFASAPVTVNYATSDGTAVAGKDYSATSGTLSIPLGSTTGIISVPVGGNTGFGPSKTFTVTLSAPINASLGDPSVGVGTIMNNNPRPAVISQFRLSGPSGASDEFIEVANLRSRPLVVDGWQVVAGATTVPLFGTIPVGGHLLIANSDGYSLNNVATADMTYTGDIPANTPFTLTNTSGVVIDSVSDLSSIAAPTSPTHEYAYIRRLESGMPAKSNSDAQDFNLVDTAVTNSTVDRTGVGPLTAARLGSPNPHNLSSTIQRNDGISNAALSIPGVAAVARYVSKGSTVDSKGRLTIRRTITNNTGAAVSALRFRIVGITAGTSTTTGVADLRAISSGGVRYYDSAHTIQRAATGMTIDAPTKPGEAPLVPTSGSSGNGGGLNSGWTAPLPGGALAPGATVNVEFLFGIQAEGNFRVVVDAELLP